LKGCRDILDGACDDWPERALYMVGPIAEARERHESAAQAAGS